MGRGKIEIKKIENANSRQVTFSKRRSGLFKKANELAILCEAEVAVIIFSNTGKLFGYASSSMAKILSRYNKCLDLTQNAAGEHKQEKTFDSEGLPCSGHGIDETSQKKQQLKDADALKEEIEKLKLKEMRLLGKDFTGMGLPELQVLEQQLNEGLLCIKERKEQLLIQELAQSKMQEQRAVLENETLRRQVEELQAFFPSTSYQAPLCFEYHSPMEQSKPPLVIEGSGSPETACNGVLMDEDSDTTLQLGPPSSICLKRKTPDDENYSTSTSETQVHPMITQK